MNVDDIIDKRWASPMAMPMAQLCRLVYTSKDGETAPDIKAIKLELKSLDINYSSVKVFSKHSTQGMVVEHKYYTAIVFRGTDMDKGVKEAVKDWKTNLDAKIIKPYDDYYFHCGFYDALMDVWSDVKDLAGIKLHRPDSESLQKPLYITGHSLGGALACLAKCRLAREGVFRDVRVYTFGQPRAVGRKTAKLANAMYDSYGTNVYRYHNHLDIVPRVPTILKGFRHFGVRIYIDRHQRLRVNPSHIRVFRDITRGFIRNLFQRRLGAIEDHDINDYIKAIYQNRWIQ